MRAIRPFLAWCEERGLELRQVEPKSILKVMQTNLGWFDKYLGQNGSSQTSEK
jgi:hypothetical protein